MFAVTSSIPVHPIFPQLHDTVFLFSACSRSDLPILFCSSICIFPWPVLLFRLYYSLVGTSLPPAFFFGRHFSSIYTFSPRGLSFICAFLYSFPTFTDYLPPLQRLPHFPIRLQQACFPHFRPVLLLPLPLQPRLVLSLQLFLPPRPFPLLLRNFLQSL